MSKWEDVGGEFYSYAMELFSKAGHVATSEPEFINHSPAQFVYFDNKSDVALSREQRNLFGMFNNVSRLFSANGCAFFAINLLSSKTDRSQVAHEIHTMLHPIVDTDGTICLFRFDDEVMLSFSGFGLRCILSDWYPMVDDNKLLLDKVDISNVSISQNIDYFLDMVYVLARPYYLSGQLSTYEVLPISFISDAGLAEVDKEEINQYVQDQINAPLHEYSNDYMEYNESLQTRSANITADLDLMLLEMEDEDDNPFGEELGHEEDLDDDEFLDESADNTEIDEYEFDNVDPEIFLDPSLMVKWINRHSQDQG